MIELDIRKDIRKAEKQLDAHARKHIPKAAQLAINRATTKTRTAARRKVAKVMNIPQKRIKDSFPIKKASRNSLIATIRGVGRPIKLIYFNGTRQLKKGVKSAAYNVRRIYRGTFITTVGAGHRGAFRRKGDPRLPIKELYGPSVPSGMEDKAVQDEMQKIAKPTFLKEFKRQLKRFIK
ncbi:MAG: phage tail protein [Verrucomicrobiota bacterium]